MVYFREFKKLEVKDAIIDLMGKFDFSSSGLQLYLEYVGIGEGKIIIFCFSDSFSEDLTELKIYTDKLFEFMKDKFDPKLTGFRVHIMREVYSKQEKKPYEHDTYD